MRMLHRFAVLGLVLTPVSTGTLLAQEPVKETGKTELEKLTETVKETERKLAEFKKNSMTEQLNILAELGELKRDLQKLRDELGRKESTSFKAMPGSDRPIDREDKQTTEEQKAAKLRQVELDLKIEKLEQELKQLKEDRQRETKRIDLTAPLNNVVKLGTVRFVNSYFTDVTVYVNGRRYELPSRQEISVTVPAGTFNFQVIEVDPFVRTRNIGPNDNYRIDIR